MSKKRSAPNVAGWFGDWISRVVAFCMTSGLSATPTRCFYWANPSVNISAADQWRTRLFTLRSTSLTRVCCREKCANYRHCKFEFIENKGCLISKLKISCWLAHNDDLERYETRFLCGGCPSFSVLNCFQKIGIFWHSGQTIKVCFTLQQSSRGRSGNERSPTLCVDESPKWFWIFWF